AQALEITETIHLASRPLSQISSGERQRVFIARAFAQNTPIILLDEPTSFLDLRHQVEIYDLLKKAQLENNKTIIAITHDINLTMQYCEKTLLLCPDKNYHIGATLDVLTKDKIEQAFGVRTLKADIGSRSIIMPVGKFFNTTN
ncbi:MAG: ABC transporter ATP-binding protein, partial [Phycisphaerae bacterium]